MMQSTCKHCGEEIGQWTDPWGQHPVWMHAPDDGPDAYRACDCHCFHCDPVNGYADEHPCSDGEEAEPTPVLHPLFQEILGNCFPRLRGAQ